MAGKTIKRRRRDDAVNRSGTANNMSDEQNDGDYEIGFGKPPRRPGLNRGGPAIRAAARAGSKNLATLSSRSSRRKSP